MIASQAIKYSSNSLEYNKRCFSTQQKLYKAMFVLRDKERISTLFHSLLKNQEESFIKRVLNYYYYGKTLLHYAIFRKNYYFIEELIKYDINVGAPWLESRYYCYNNIFNITALYHWLPLHTAVRNDDDRLIELLIKGAKKQKLDLPKFLNSLEYGGSFYSSILLAIMLGKTKILNLLLNELKAVSLYKDFYDKLGEIVNEIVKLYKQNLLFLSLYDCLAPVYHYVNFNYEGHIYGWLKERLIYDNQDVEVKKIEIFSMFNYIKDNYNIISLGKCLLRGLILAKESKKLEVFDIVLSYFQEAYSVTIVCNKKNRLGKCYQTLRLSLTNWLTSDGHDDLGTHILNDIKDNFNQIIYKDLQGCFIYFIRSNNVNKISCLFNYIKYNLRDFISEMLCSTLVCSIVFGSQEMKKVVKDYVNGFIKNEGCFKKDVLYFIVDLFYPDNSNFTKRAKTQLILLSKYLSSNNKIIDVNNKKLLKSIKNFPSNDEPIKEILYEVLGVSKEEMLQLVRQVLIMEEKEKLEIQDYKRYSLFPNCSSNSCTPGNSLNTADYYEVDRMNSWLSIPNNNHNPRSGFENITVSLALSRFIKM